MPIELSASQPWPGLATYEEDARAFFHGRERETETLLQMIRAAPLSVLYGRSGLGKSSLLKAGLFPLLRAQCFLPVYLRLSYDGKADVDPVGQIAQRLSEEIDAAGLEAPARDASESLWHWLHRRDFELWSADNRLWTPVLVFDQFEELFSRTGGNVRLIGEVFDTLADLAENRIEQRVADSRHEQAELDLIGQRYRMLLSFREDFLPDVRAWERQVPSLLRNDLRLVAMSREQAVGAVRAAGGDLLAPKAAERLVDFVGALAASTRGPESVSTTLSGRRASLTIEPALLSLCGAQLARRLAPGQKIDTALLSQVGFNILEGFYRDALADMPDGVQTFIEDYLLQGDRTRGSYARDEALAQRYITAEQLALLTEQRRLLRVAQEGGVPRIELIHDRLVDVVRAARDRRHAVRQAEAARLQERREAADRLAAEQAARLQTETRAREKAERDGLRIAQSKRRVQLALVAAVAMLAAAGTQTFRAMQAADEATLARADAEQKNLALLQTTSVLVANSLRDSGLSEAVGVWLDTAPPSPGTARLAQALRAQAALVDFWPAAQSAGGATPPPPARQAEVVLFQRFARAPTQQALVEDALRGLEFPVRQDPNANPGSASVLLAGADVPLKDLQAVALALIRAGVPVVEVYRWGSERPPPYPVNYNAGLSSIGVVAAVLPAAGERPPLSVEQLVDPAFAR